MVMNTRSGSQTNRQPVAPQEPVIQKDPHVVVGSNPIDGAKLLVQFPVWCESALSFDVLHASL
jgi:hypothetical protein